VQHAVGNWDSYGNDNGQNTYAYKPVNGPWSLLIWDFNIVLGNGSDGPTGDNLFKTGDPMTTTMYNTPAFRRAYWRAMQEIVNSPMLTNQVNPLLDARYAAFKANGANVTAPTSLKSWIARRRTYLLSKLSTVAADFNVTDYALAPTTSGDTLVIHGTAPVAVKSIQVNGLAVPVTWTSVSNWTVNVPRDTSRTSISINGFDRQDQVVANAPITLTLTQPTAPPNLLEINISPGGPATLTWAAQVGRAYRVQFKNALTEPVWQDFGGRVVATGSIASQSDVALPPSGTRFYRVRQEQ
jgi:hypothetical protein